MAKKLFKQQKINLQLRFNLLNFVLPKFNVYENQIV
jgi:hypothetical protein